MTTQSLSLEDCCLLRLVCHLEDYPPEALASLPLHLRRSLLLSLPAVDICQLEGTAVTQGVDMEASVWRELLEQLPKANRSLGVRQNSLPQSGTRENFLNKVVDSILHGETSTAGDCLFAVHGPLRDNVAPPVSPYSVGTPHRHIEASSEESFAIQVLSALVNQCKYLPDDVLFECEQLGQTNMWKRRNMVMLAMLGNLLSQTTSLTFFAEDSNSGILSIPRNIFEVIFSRSKPVLTSLTLNGRLDFVLAAVADTELFFAPAQNQSKVRSLYPQLLSCSLPYSGLTSLDVGGSDELDPEEETVICKQLHSIVLYQRALESFTMCSFPSCPNINAFKLYTTLGRLFYQPQFRVLKVELGDLYWNDLSVLILPFLTAPINPSRQQQLSFRENTFSLNGPPPSVEAKFDSSSVMPGKALIFEDTIWDGDNVASRGDPRVFLQWLAELNIPSMLSSFEFSILDAPPESLGTAMSLLKDETSAALLESFSIGWAPLCLESSPNPFIYLFSSTWLKRVCLVWSAFNDKLPMLTQGLLKQVPHGVLQDLNLESNDLSSSSDEDFQEFSDAIFLLPQLKKLKLTLTSNKLKARHFSILYGAWRRSNTDRMDTLKVKGNDYEDNTSLLHRIAVHGDFISAK